MMTRVDIAADLNSEDETGFVWTFLDEADDPSVIRPGEVVVAGSPLTSAVSARRSALVTRTDVVWTKEQ
jgi:hypothetical protein